MFDSSIFLRTQTYIDREKFFILFFQQIVACVWGGLCVCVDTKRFNEQINEEMPIAWKENPMRERSASNSLNWERERERESNYNGESLSRINLLVQDSNPRLL
jgi:hypothetical protein